MTTLSIEIDDIAARIDEREARPNAATMQAIDDVEHKRNLVGPFHSVDDLMRDLNA